MEMFLLKSQLLETFLSCKCKMDLAEHTDKKDAETDKFRADAAF